MTSVLVELTPEQREFLLRVIDQVLLALANDPERLRTKLEGLWQALDTGLEVDPPWHMRGVMPGGAGQAGRGVGEGAYCGGDPFGPPVPFPDDDGAVVTAITLDAYRRNPALAAYVIGRAIEEASLDDGDSEST